MKVGAYSLHNITCNSEQNFLFHQTVAVLFSFEVFWKGMNAYRGISAVVLILLELNWEMVTAGITRLSLLPTSVPSLLLDFWVFLLHSLVEVNLTVRKEPTERKQVR